MLDPVHLAKKALRSTMRQTLAALSHQSRNIQSIALGELLAARFASWQVEQSQPLLVAFIPRADEPDIQPFLNQIRARGIAVALVRQEHNGPGLRLWPVGASDLEFLPGQNLYQPPASWPSITAQGRNLFVLVPGLAFSVQGHRLGRGRGFYDTFLDQMGTLPLSLSTVGLCFSCQIVEHLPTEPHDRLLDTVLFVS